MSNRKSVREVSYRDKPNTSGYNPQSSIMTDNSERLRDNLEQFKKSKLLKEMKQKTKSDATCEQIESKKDRR